MSFKKIALQEDVKKQSFYELDFDRALILFRKHIYTNDVFTLIQNQNLIKFENLEFLPKSLKIYEISNILKVKKCIEND